MTDVNYNTFTPDSGSGATGETKKSNGLLLLVLGGAGLLGAFVLWKKYFAGGESGTKQQTNTGYEGVVFGSGGDTISGGTVPADPLAPGVGGGLGAVVVPSVFAVPVPKSSAADIVAPAVPAVPVDPTKSAGMYAVNVPGTSYTGDGKTVQVGSVDYVSTITGIAYETAKNGMGYSPAGVVAIAGNVAEGIKHTENAALSAISAQNAAARSSSSSGGSSGTTVKAAEKKAATTTAAKGGAAYNSYSAATAKGRH